MTTHLGNDGRVVCECCQTHPAELALAVCLGTEDMTVILLCDTCFMGIRPYLDDEGYHYAGKDFSENTEDPMPPEGCDGDYEGFVRHHI